MPRINPRRSTRKCAIPSQAVRSKQYVPDNVHPCRNHDGTSGWQRPTSHAKTLALTCCSRCRDSGLAPPPPPIPPVTSRLIGRCGLACADAVSCSVTGSHGAPITQPGRLPLPSAQLPDMNAWLAQAQCITTFQAGLANTTTETGFTFLTAALTAISGTPDAGIFPSAGDGVTLLAPDDIAFTTALQNSGLSLQTAETTLGSKVLRTGPPLCDCASVCGSFNLTASFAHTARHFFTLPQD